MRQVEFENGAYQRTLEKVAARHQLSALNEELQLVRRMLEYKQLLFDEGKADYEAVAQAQLRVLHVQQSIGILKLKLEPNGP